jgi:transcriptional regulator with AAA-type ATPase domain
MSTGLDTLSATTGSARDPLRDAPQPHIMLVVERTRPLAGGSRHSLANIEHVTIGRGHERTAERILHDGRPTLRLTVPDVRMSSRHARIEWQGNAWTLVDQGSTNGCRVNRRDVKSAILSDGDVLELGRTFFRFRSGLATPPQAVGDVDSASLRGLTGLFGTLLPWLSRDLDVLEKVARSDGSVLLLGETGTGKDLLAQGIHEQSGRPGPLVAVNCGALPAALVESLLFGHVRGAFSGAVGPEVGFVRAAHKGTLFLDEVGDLPRGSQAALLRVLQEREVVPVGTTEAVTVDLRVVAATHRPLHELVQAGDFRQDLLARLSGFVFSVPPLRDRIEDVGVLAAALLAQLVPAGAPGASFDAESAYALLEHPWPNNVRELRQRLEHGILLAIEGRIALPDLPGSLGGPCARTGLRPGAVGRSTSAAPGDMSAEDARIFTQLVDQLREHRGNVTRAGQAMGKARTQVQRWVKRFGIDVRAFRS